MAVNDKGAGPKIGQNVLYNNGGTPAVIVPAIINQVNVNGTVSLITFPVADPAQQNNVAFSPLNQAINTWWYGDFF